MFETAETGNKLDKDEYRNMLPGLRAELLQVQRSLRKADFPVIILFAGVDGAGKHETVNLLNEWMDPRWTVTRAYGAQTEDERDRPDYWKYWRDLPPGGQIGLFLSAWYTRPLLGHVNKETSDVEFDEQLTRVTEFERTLTDDGALILKFWMHLDKKRQKKRLKKLAADPLTDWQVKPKDWDHLELYDRFIASAKHLISRTSTGTAEWKIVEGSDARYRAIEVATQVRDAIQRHGQARAAQQKAAVSVEGNTALSQPAEAETQSAKITVLSTLDMEQSLERSNYRSRLKELQAELAQLQRQALAKRKSTILMFEGWDAAGKGGAIRRVIHALDARHYRVIPIAAPTDEERAQQHLWRFWRHLPRAGRVTIFDRSWYGRVLVERIEGFAREDEWRRGYVEINEFERALVEHGVVLCKFWLHITKDEQLRRFEDREKTPYKSWKLTDEDWRNRERWDDYESAVDEMVARTSTGFAPWTLVEANQKYFTRIKVLETVCDRLRDSLKKD